MKNEKTKNIFRFFFVFICFFFCFFGQGSTASQKIRFDPWVYKLVMNSLEKGSLEEAFFKDASDGKLDRVSLELASLIASGISGASFEKYLKKVDAIQNSISSDHSFRNLSKEEKPRYILRWLHRYLLLEYKAYASSMKKILFTGEYNCVSSTILYNALLRRYNYNVNAIQTQTHVFSKIKFHKRDIEVETTHTFGYDPGKRFYRSFKGYVEFIIVRPEEYSGKKRLLDDIGLVATIYFNRSFQQVESGDFKNALMNYAKGYLLDPGFPNAREYIADLYLCLGNRFYEIDRYQDALSVYIMMLTWPYIQKYPKKTILINNRRAALSKAVTNLVGRKSYKTAHELIIDYAKKDSDDAEIKEQLLYVYVHWADHLMKSGKWNKARDIYLSLFDRYPHEPLLKNNINALYYSWSDIFIKKGKWEAAERVYVDACRRFPNETFYRHNLQALYSQWAKAKYNEGKYEEAKRLYKKMETRY